MIQYTYINCESKENKRLIRVFYLSKETQTPNLLSLLRSIANLRTQFIDNLKQSSNGSIPNFPLKLSLRPCKLPQIVILFSNSSIDLFESGTDSPVSRKQTLYFILQSK